MTPHQELLKIDDQLAKLLLRRKLYCPSPDHKIKSIFVAVEQVYGISKDELLLGGRPEQIAYARQVAMCLMLEFGFKLDTAVGSMGKTDHSTAIYARKKVSAMYETEESRREDYQRVRKIVGLPVHAEIGRATKKPK